MPSLVDMNSVVLEKKDSFNFVSIFSLFCYYLPLERGGALHLDKLESQGCFVPSLVEIDLVVLEKKLKSENLNDNNVDHNR